MTRSPEAENKYIKQSGGRGQYGHARIAIKPLEPVVEGAKVAKNVKREEGFEFINSIKGGIIPNEYIPAVEKGVKEAMARGVLAGYPMTNISVELNFGSFHEVDSSEMAFKMSGSLAFQDAAKQAGPVLLEPIMKIEVIMPERFMGDVNGSLSAKRGQIESMEELGNGIKSIKAKAPLAEMFEYVTALRSMTEGRGSFTMEPLEYAIVPPNVAEAIIAKRGGVARRGV